MHLERKSLSLQLPVKKVISLFVSFALRGIPIMAVSKNVAFNLEVIEVTKQHFSQNSLRSRRLEVVGEKENGRARETCEG